MILCFGTYANILIKCSLPGTTNRIMLSTLVGTIDPGNSYSDKNNDTSVSRLMNCDRDFPVVKTSPSDGPVRSVGGSQTNIVDLAKDTDPAALAEMFSPVVSLLDEDRKKAAVGALHHVIQSDETLNGPHRELFMKCTGHTAAQIVNTKKVDLQSFLARIFLYTILINENKKGKPYLFEIKSDGFIDRFAAYAVAFSEAAKNDEGSSLYEGSDAYLDGLVDKYNRIPTLLYKEDLVPFRNYYVPNDVIWHEPVPGERLSWYDRRITNVSISKMLEVSRYLVLSGTGGLGKSMMMRSLLLSSAEDYDSIGLLPFFIPLKDYEADFSTMNEYVFSTACNLWPELTMGKLEKILSSGSALLLFDGLDEIHSSKLVDFTKKMNAFRDRYSKNAFIISSRPYSNFQSFNRSTVLYLQPFTKPQALELVDRYNYRSDAPKLQAAFRAQLDHELFSTHKGFSDNPLLLSIMILTFEMDAEVPLEKYLFYQEAYTVLSRRHDANKDGFKRKLETGWNANQFADFFSFFCAASYADGIVSFTLPQMEHYFRTLTKKYKITGITVDDFIHDLTNNLCLMYLDGSKYSFTHRSFQEYFCAKYFNAQLDELLTAVIPIFDRNDRTKKGDSAIEMLFDMKPKAVEKYLITPYLRNLINECEDQEGIWTFLDKLYADYEMADGVALADDNYCRPGSNLYAFILDHYSVPLLTPLPEQFPNIDFYTQGIMVYREDKNEDDWKENLPIDYEDEFGEPAETGHIYSVRWNKVHDDYKEHPHSLEGFIPAVEDPENAFMAEYIAVKDLLARLEKRSAAIPQSSNLFDMME